MEFMRIFTYCLSLICFNCYNVQIYIFLSNENKRTLIKPNFDAVFFPLLFYRVSTTILLRRLFSRTTPVTGSPTTRTITTNHDVNRNSSTFFIHVMYRTISFACFILLSFITYYFVNKLSIDRSILL